MPNPAADWPGATPTLDRHVKPHTLSGSLHDVSSTVHPSGVVTVVFSRSAGSVSNRVTPVAWHSRPDDLFSRTNVSLLPREGPRNSNQASHPVADGVPAGSAGGATVPDDAQAASPESHTTATTQPVPVMLRPLVRRTPGISCEAVPASMPSTGAGMRRHVHAGNHAAESFVSFIPLFCGAPRSCVRNLEDLVPDRGRRLKPLLRLALTVRREQFQAGILDHQLAVLEVSADPNEPWQARGFTQG